LERSAGAYDGPGILHLFTTGDVGTVEGVAERLWGSPLEIRHIDV
jgi:hypothetical protein